MRRSLKDVQCDPYPPPPICPFCNSFCHIRFSENGAITFISDRRCVVCFILFGIARLDNNHSIVEAE